MKKATKVWLWLGGLATAGLVGLGVYEETKKTSSTQTGGNQNPVNTKNPVNVPVNTKNPVNVPVNVGIPLQGETPGPATQSITVTTNGTFTAKAVKNGTLNVTAPWQIGGIDGGAAVSNESAFGTSATITLSGSPGQITVNGPGQGGNPNFKQLTATINVS